MYHTYGEAFTRMESRKGFMWRGMEVATEERDFDLQRLLSPPLFNDPVVATLGCTWRPPLSPRPSPSKSAAHPPGPFVIGVSLCALDRLYRQFRRDKRPP